MLSFNFRLPTTLLFGPGRLAELETTPLLPAGKQALIFIGQSGNILRQGYLGRVQGLLAARGVKSAVFDGVRANPRVEDVDAAAKQARDMRCVRSCPLLTVTKRGKAASPTRRSASRGTGKPHSTSGHTGANATCGPSTSVRKRSRLWPPS